MHWIYLFSLGQSLKNDHKDVFKRKAHLKYIFLVQNAYFVYIDQIAREIISFPQGLCSSQDGLLHLSIFKSDTWRLSIYREILVPWISHLSSASEARFKKIEKEKHEKGLVVSIKSSFTWWTWEDGFNKVKSENAYNSLLPSFC